MASKFKVKLKIQGFELELEGSKDDVAEMSQSISEQMGSLLRPGASMIEGTPIVPVNTNDSVTKIADRRPRKKRVSSGANEAEDTAVAIEFVVDPAKHGMPSQKWSTSQKVFWLLHVLGEVGKGNSHSTRAIVATFNQHFKQAGMIQVGNTNRDLGKIKVTSKPTPISEDTTQSPPHWFLTDEGIKRASALIAESVGGQQAN